MQSYPLSFRFNLPPSYLGGFDSPVPENPLRFPSCRCPWTQRKRVGQLVPGPFFSFFPPEGALWSLRRFRKFSAVGFQNRPLFVSDMTSCRTGRVFHDFPSGPEPAFSYGSFFPFAEVVTLPSVLWSLRMSPYLVERLPLRQGLFEFPFEGVKDFVAHDHRRRPFPSFFGAPRSMISSADASCLIPSLYTSFAPPFLFALGQTAENGVGHHTFPFPLTPS